MNEQTFRRTRAACYYTNITVSTVVCLPPLLFSTFRSLYGISYTLLGTLVLVNFCTQLAVDLILTFWGRCFNTKWLLRGMPLLTTAGLLIYALVPILLPQYAFAGLLCGTVTFSAAAGCNEVLISPIVAALPSDDPGRDMSRLHSLYGYGVLGVVAISTAFFRLFGAESWLWLAVLFAVLPVGAVVMLLRSPIPEIELSEQKSAGGRNRLLRGPVLFCLLCIFAGGLTELTMTNWVCLYLEKGMGLPKAVGDVLGLAAFSALLAITRTMYAKFGRSIEKVLCWSMGSAACCYVLAGATPVPAIAVAACMLTGICSAMLWPGTLILLEERVPHPGVAAYALMAAGGDLGGAAGPQLLGAVVDGISASEWAARVGRMLTLSAEQVGMKVAMLLAALIPAAGLALLLWDRRRRRWLK